MKKYAFCMVLLMSLLVGCGEAPPPQKQSPDKLFESERETLHKAESVGQAVNQEAEEQQQDINRQTE